MESKGYEDGWGSTEFCLGCSFPLLCLFNFIRRRLSRAAAKEEKKFDWFCCDFDAWMPRSLFFYFIFGGASFFFKCFRLEFGGGFKGNRARSLMKIGKKEINLAAWVFLGWGD
ncbi:hypothetical protein ACQKWADRAFT_242971 [Trichoderma austrokoningii]